MTTEERISNLKSEIDKQKIYLEQVDKRSKIAGKMKANLKDMEFRLWRLENPESYENHRQALQDYVDNTHIF